MNVIWDLIDRIKLNKNRILWSMSIALILIFFLSVGSICQLIFLNIFNTDVSNLYDLLFPNQVTEKISFFEFILNITVTEFILFFLINYLIVYIFLNNNSAKKFFLNLSFAISLCLMVADFIISIRFGEKPYIIENVASNILGGFFLSFILTILIYFSNKIIDPNISLKTLYKNLIFLLLCFSFLYILYFIFVNIFQSSSTKIKAEIIPNFGINYIISDDNESNGKENENKNFGVATKKELRLKSIEYIGMEKLNFSYKYDGRSEIDLMFYDGCADTSTEDLISMKTAKLKLPNSKKLNFYINPGYTVFKAGVKSSRQNAFFDGNVHEAELQVGSFKKDLFNVEYFIKKDPKMRLVSESDLDYYRFDLVFLDVNGLADRELLVKSLNKKIKFKPIGSMDMNKKLKCRAITTISESMNYETPVVSIIIKIKKDMKISDYGKNSDLSFDGVKGWIKGYDLNSSEISEFVSDGSIDSLSLVGHFKSLYIDNEKIEVNTINNLSLMNGEINSTLYNGNLKINADVDIAYFDGDRVSKSRWEKISVYIKGILVLFLPAFYYLARKFLGIIRNDEEILEM